MLNPQRGDVWWDRGRPSNERAEALLAVMTVEEKVAQLGALWMNESAAEARRLATEGVSADELAEAIPHGIGHLTRPIGCAPDALAGARLVAGVQAWIEANTRLGIPALVHEECLTGLMARGAVVTPSPLNVGAAFDPGLARRIGELIGRDCASSGVHVGLGPVIDVPADQRWGRVEECFSEDAWLTAACGAQFVAGLQSAGVAAMIKHFVGHGASVGGRNCAPAALGPRQLVERHLLAFEAAIAIGADMVMAAYHDIDGVPLCADRRLLMNVLREQLGFDGVVVSDYWAIDWLHEEHAVTASRAESAAVALRAGVDVELPRLRCYRHLQALVDGGVVPVAVLDRAVRHVLELKVRLGLFDGPLPLRRHAPSRAEQLATCREIAAAGITVVENDGVLPLRSSASVMVCGPNAHAGAALCGNYSWPNHIGYHFGGVDLPSVADRLSQRHAGAVMIVQGCSHTGSTDDERHIAEAARRARTVDLVVAVVGDRVGHFNRGTVGEGTDRDRLDLPGRQASLIEALCDSGAAVVVVHVGGRAVDLGPLADRASAVVCAFLPGEAGADAIVDVLSGTVDATGRLPISTGVGAGAQPAPYSATKLARRAYVDAPPARWPFGHGLSYTTFAYSDGSVGFDGDDLVASVRVTNTGQRPGVAVVQCYVTDEVASTVRSDKELRGVARVVLPPSADADVEFTIPSALLGIADADGSVVVEPGGFVVRAGDSSASAMELGRATITGERRVVARPRRVEPVASIRWRSAERDKAAS